MSIADTRGIFAIRIAHEGFDFVPTTINDPVPTGAQLLSAAGRRPAADHLIFQVLPDGALEEIRPEETADLRAPGAERFVTFRSDRSFRLHVNEQARDWGLQTVSGLQLKQLAGLVPAHHDVYQIILGGENRLIPDDQKADLGGREVERFATRPIAIEIFVNTRPEVVNQRVLDFWGVVRLAHPDANAEDVNAEYTVTYSRGPRANPAGNLVPGQSVQVQGGMEFYVLLTDKS